MKKITYGDGDDHNDEDNSDDDDISGSNNYDDYACDSSYSRGEEEDKMVVVLMRMESLILTQDWLWPPEDQWAKAFRALLTRTNLPPGSEPMAGQSRLFLENIEHNIPSRVFAFVYISFALSNHSRI